MKVPRERKRRRTKDVSGSKEKKPKKDKKNGRPSSTLGFRLGLR